MILSAILPIIGKVIDRVIPDKNERAKAKEAMAKLEQSGELTIMMKQIEVNANEANHKSLFVAGWRPFIGWTCGVAFGYHFLAYPIASVIFTLNGIDESSLPTFDMGSLLTVMMGMLGLGGLRTFEKFKKVN